MENEEQRLRYPVGIEEERDVYSKTYSDALKHELLNDIKMLPAMLELAVQNLDADQLDTPYRPGGWTVHQLIHHIADSHINAYIRFKLALTEDNPVIKPYDQDAWATLPDTKNLPINISLTLLHALHARWYQTMYDMTEEQWQRTIYHPERKRTLTLWELLKSYSWHGLHHTAHITKLRERMKWN
jgi:uncharacterized damage-inducible protein DinB